MCKEALVPQRGPLMMSVYFDLFLIRYISVFPLPFLLRILSASSVGQEGISRACSDLLFFPDPEHFVGSQCLRRRGP